MSLSKTSRPIHISITGLIGVGKSTAAKAVAAHFGVPYYAEKVAENELLTDFYADMRRYGFALQLHLLNNRWEQQQVIAHSGTGGIQDKAIDEDKVFARVLASGGLMDEKELSIYMRTLANFKKHMLKPHLIIHLDASPEVCLARIAERIKKNPVERKMETGIDLPYLTKLSNEYEVLIEETKEEGIPVIRVDWNQFRPMEDLIRDIDKTWQSISNVHRIPAVAQQ